MNNYGKHRRNGIDNLQVALKKIMRDRKEKVAFMTANERFSYGDITKQIKAQYDEYRSHNVSKIALCMPNSVEFCIQFLTAVLYLDEVYIFSPLWEETVVIKYVRIIRYRCWFVKRIEKSFLRTNLPPNLKMIQKLSCLLQERCIRLKELSLLVKVFMQMH